MALLKIEHSELSERADFAFYGATLVGLVAYAAWTLPAQDASGWLRGGLWLLAGALGWTLIEYATHRWVLHQLAPFRRWHGEHHQRPKAWIGLPTVASASLFALFVFAPLAWGVGRGAAAAFTFGTLCGYLYYAALHHAMHHAHRGGHWLERQRHWHARHHQGGAGITAGFGVTTRFWDHVFATAHRTEGQPYHPSHPHSRTWL